MNPPLATERLILRQLTVQDAPFILQLLNDEAWLRNIGDKQVYDLEGAQRYIEQGPGKMFRDFGFNLMLVQDILSGHSMGLCGLLKRDFLQHPDIGFALLPDYRGKGIALEACKLVLQDANQRLSITKVEAIVSPENTASIKVLEKLGMKYVRELLLPDYPQPTLLYSI